MRINYIALASFEQVVILTFLTLGEHRQALRGGRRWRFVHGGFTLNALDLTDMRVWLFDICLLILYIHSCNWILSLLFLGVIFYFFFF